MRKPCPRPGSPECCENCAECNNGPEARRRQRMFDEEAAGEMDALIMDEQIDHGY